MKMRKLFLGALMVVMAMSLAACHHAKPKADAHAKKFKEFHSIVDYDFVAKNLIVPRNINKVAIIDSRPYKPKYIAGFIPGAISLSATKFKSDAAKVLPANKDAVLIFYCGGFT